MDELLTKPAQTIAPDTEPSGWMSPDGEFRNGAPEGIQALLDAKKWTNVGQLADAYGELEKFKGIGEHLVIPETEDAEGWSDVFNKLGRPESHDKYEFTYDGDVKLSDELTGQFKEFAHELGLSQKQFQDIVSFQLDAVGAQSQAYDTQLETDKAAAMETLKAKYGADTPTKITGAREIAEQLGIYETLERKGLASDPDIIDMLATIKGRTAEDVIAPQTATVIETTPLERLAEIKKSDSFTQKFHPDHRKTMAEFMALNQEIANSGQGQAPRS